jgi:hypothetical protein
MLAEFTVELGADHPTLAVPWFDPESGCKYVDLRLDSTALELIEESRHPEMRHMLAALNAPPSSLQTAKCDVWFSEEITEEEAIFGAACKFGSYVDGFFVALAPRSSFPMHEAFAKRLVELLRRAPELQASFEVILRTAHYAEGDDVREGFYFTFYVYGYGDDEQQARQAWGIALKLTTNAIRQISSI